MLNNYLNSFYYKYSPIVELDLIFYSAFVRNLKLIISKRLHKGFFASLLSSSLYTRTYYYLYFAQQWLNMLFRISSENHSCSVSLEQRFDYFTYSNFDTIICYILLSEFTTQSKNKLDDTSLKCRTTWSIFN